MHEGGVQTSLHRRWPSKANQRADQSPANQGRAHGVIRACADQETIYITLQQTTLLPRSLRQSTLHQWQITSAEKINADEDQHTPDCINSNLVTSFKATQELLLHQVNRTQLAEAVGDLCTPSFRKYWSLTLGI